VAVEIDETLFKIKGSHIGMPCSYMLLKRNPYKTATPQTKNNSTCQKTPDRQTTELEKIIRQPLELTPTASRASFALEDAMSIWSRCRCIMPSLRRSRTYTTELKMLIIGSFNS
jgi:hypothetical protein